MADDAETYFLLLLADSNLPTGAFVASSGLESYLKHATISTGSAESRVLAFLRDSLASYGRSSLPFVSDVHQLAMDFIQNGGGVQEETAGIMKVVDKLSTIDELYEAQTLNHVARRASKSQGAALLTLYTKGFSRPASLAQVSDPGSQQQETRTIKAIEQFKLRMRREDTPGHLPVCWGVLTAALGLSLDRTQYLYLFLHARGLLSASVRLNEVGPYNAQQILLHAVKPLIAEEVARCKNLRTGLSTGPDQEFDETVNGPVNTWPLGELLATRHDLQHSRIFNS